MNDLERNDINAKVIEELMYRKLVHEALAQNPDETVYKHFVYSLLRNCCPAKVIFNATTDPEFIKWVEGECDEEE